MRVPVCQPACAHRTFQHYHQTDNCNNFDSHSIISEPAMSRHIIVKEVPVCQPVQQQQPIEQPTFIRKYVTTKTTTTHQGIPPQLLAHSASSSNIPKENLILMNQQQQQQKYQSTNHVRSSSIPRLEEIFTNNSAPAGSTTTRYYTTRNYTSSNAEQQQQQQQQISNSQQQSTTKTHTLPVNFSNQNISSGYQTTAANTPNGNRNSNSSSCIDYSNTFYNTDWKLRHGNIEKPVLATTIPVKTSSTSTTPTSIPIYQQNQQNNNQSNIAYSLDGIVLQ